MTILVCMVVVKSDEKFHSSKKGWNENVSIPGFNKSSLTCIPNMTILACMVVENFLTKDFILRSMKGKKFVNTWKNKLEKAGSQSQDTKSHHQPAI